jgi:protein-tyrosine-phosphatase
MLDRAERVITMGCGIDEACPTSFTITENWNLTDPEGKSLDEIRKIRDEIKLRVKQLIEEISL